MGECCLDVSSELEHLLMSYEIYAKNMSNWTGKNKKRTNMIQLEDYNEQKN
jgi:hypothetical protein